MRGRAAQRPVEPKVHMAALDLPLLLLGLAIGAFAAGHALLNKRRPQSAFGWIAVCFTLPYLGPLLYYAFGINRVRTRAQQLRARNPRKTREQASDSTLRTGLEARSRAASTGNAVEALHDGEQAFPAMLEAIGHARERVYLSSYIFSGEGVGADFIAALAEADARGAEVRVLVDGVGELYSWPRVGTLLRRRGIRCARFLPPRLVPPALRINLRNHRKILICDEAAAFVGGLNIHDRHLAGRSEPHRIVDLHFRIRGPALRELAAVFARDWQFAAGETLAALPGGDAVQHGAAAVPPRPGSARCRVVPDGPDEPLAPATSLLLAAVGRARRRVGIMTPYFLPPRELMGTLQSAAARGLDVSVLLPAENNLPYVHRATRKMLWELLEHGVRIYYQPPPFVHTKLLLVDEECAIVGSGNIDPRSLRLNFELAVEIFDAGLLEHLDRHFAAARGKSAPVSLADVDARSLPTRLLDGVAWLFSPYL